MAYLFGVLTVLVILPILGYWVDKKYMLQPKIDHIPTKKNDPIKVTEPFLSKVSINELGEVVETIHFNNETFDIKFNCIRCHPIYGPVMAFNNKYDHDNN